MRSPAVRARTLSWQDGRRWQRWIAATLSVALIATLSETPVFAAPKAQSPIKPACPAERPDKISAGMAARLCEGRVEVSSLKTETTQVWAEKDGTFTVDASFAPVRVKSGTSWVDVDLTLIKAADGSITPRAHALGLAFSGAQSTAGNHDLAAFGAGADRVTLGWPGRLPEPVLSGTRATYLSIRAGVDLIMEATSRGFEQYFVVKDRAGLASVATIALPWRTPTGVTTTRSKNGDLELRDKEGNARGRMPSAYMWDASVDASGDHARRAKVDLAVRANRAVKGGSELAMTPDAAFLARTDLAFPLTIDPFYAAVFPYEDIFVQTSWGVDTSHHADLRLGTYNGGGDTARTYLNIDTSEIHGTRINWATLKLWEWDSQSCTPTSWEAWRTQAVSMSVKWTTQPNFVGGWYEKLGTSTQTLGYSASCNDNWVEVDATKGFQTAADTGMNSLTIGLKATNEYDSNSYMKFRSADYSASGPFPHIMLNYDYRPEIESQETTPSSVCTTGVSRPYINNLRPTLQAQLSDPEGAPITATFEWFVTGGGIIGSTTTSQQASNTDFSAVVPAGAFANGGTYSWRVRGVDAAGSTSYWSSWCEFTIDTTEPTITPGVWSPSFPQNGWAGVSGTAGNFTFGPGIGGGGAPSGRWLFNEGTGSTVVDTSGNNRPLTLGGGAVFAGDRGGSVLRVAGGGYAATATPPFNTNSSFTVAAWAKPSAVPTYSTVLSIDGGAGLPGFDLGTRDGKWHFDRRPYRDVYAYPTGVDGPAVTAGVWTHVMGVYDYAASKLRLYINGGFIGEVGWGQPYAWQSTGGLQVGRSGGWNGDFFYGDIDEVRAFNRVASVSEVLDGGDIASYQYGLDTNPPSTTVNAWNGSWGNDATITVTPATDGPHTLYVRSQDRAGNQSAIVAYPFNVGPGGITSPKGGDVTGSQTKISSVAHPSTTGVTYQWRRGDADAWVDIPVAHVVKSVGGGAVTSWPLATTGSGSFADLNWNVEATLAAADAQSIPRDGPLQVRASYTGGIGGPASPIKITYDRDRASAASAEAGPGSVNLITGNFTLGGSDVAAAGMTVTRGFNSRQAGKVDAMFGPGWVSSVVVPEAAAMYKQLNVYTNIVQVTLPNDTTLGFTKKATTGTGATYDPPLSALDLTLNYATATDSYRLTDTDGNATTFGRQSTDPAGQYVPTAVTPAATTDTTTLSWQKVTVDGIDLMRPTRAVAPAPTGVNCTVSLVRGCKALTFTYASSTTATSSIPGDYAGRLREVMFTAYDPATSAMANVVVSRYAYDTAGRLTVVWDPRVDWVDLGGITRHVQVQFAYNADGLLISLAPSGQEPWQFTYTTLPSDPAKGRLATVARSALAAGTATTTVVYKVPISGTGSAYDLSATQTARWGQMQAPVDATAVFPATQIPSGNQATGVVPSSYEQAVVTYLDTNSRTVNTVAPGGNVVTTWYDAFGHTVRGLTARNRKRALDASGSDSEAAEATLAAALSTVNVYSVDGRRLTDTFGPEHDVTLSSGLVVRGRTHAATVYDEGAPTTGAPYDLPTTRTASVRYTDGEGYAAEGDKRVTTTQYDWNLRLPVVETVDPSGLKLTTRTAYDSEGNIVSTTSPGGGTSTTTPSTQITVDYRSGTGSGYAECDNHPEWAGEACRVQVGGQPASGFELPVAVTTYNLYGEIASTVEKTSAGVLRTATTTFDAAGRIATTSIEAPGLGQALETRRAVYDAATGQATRSQTLNAGGSVTAEVIRGYDTLGRLTAYTDASGTMSTTTYDIMSRVATTNDTNATRTYTYDGGTERRGLITSVNETNVGTFSGSYDADGKLVAQSWPNGVNINATPDEEGFATGVTYDQPGCGQPSCVLYTETAQRNAHGLTTQRTSTLSGQAYRFDTAGRLTGVSDTVGGQCNSRAYVFDAATNRRTASAYGPGGGGACQTSTGAVETLLSYDEADRSTSAGYTYDSLGRTLTMPGADSAIPTGGQVGLGYYANDMVRTITQGSRTATYTLDVTGNRFRSWTDSALSSGATKIHHYADDSDTPAWTDEGDGSSSRVVKSIAGVAASRTSSGVAWTVSNLHGDLVAGLSTTGFGLAYTSEQMEYGQPRNGTDAGSRRYGWLGAAQRQADTPGGLILMGVRLYAPGSGRFLSVDSVSGGNANAYTYPADPVNAVDLDGRIWAWLVDAGIAALGNFATSYACKWLVNPLQIIGCGALVGAVVGAVTYVAATKLLNRGRFEWRGLAEAAISGLFGGIGNALGGPAGTWLKGFLKSLLRRLMAAIKPKLRRLGFAALVGFLSYIEYVLLDAVDRGRR